MTLEKFQEDERRWFLARIEALEGTNRDLGQYAGRLVDKCLKLEATLRWHAQTVHQAHHDGSAEDCPKSTCVAARDAL